MLQITELDSLEKEKLLVPVFCFSVYEDIHLIWFVSTIVSVNALRKVTLVIIQKSPFQGLKSESGNIHWGTVSFVVSGSLYCWLKTCIRFFSYLLNNLTGYLIKHFRVNKVIIKSALCCTFLKGVLLLSYVKSIHWRVLALILLRKIIAFFKIAHSNTFPTVFL